MLKTGETKTVSQKSTKTPRLSQFSKPRLASRAGLAQLDTKTTNLDAKKNLGAERQKNRPRENAFAEVFPGRPKFGVRSETIEHSNFVMATSGVLECNSHFKYPKFSPAALNNSAIWLQIVLFLNIF